MKAATNLGIAFILFGMAAVVYQGMIAYTTRDDNVIGLGALHATVDNTRIIPLPPVVGGLALMGGIALLIVGAKKA